MKLLVAFLATACAFKVQPVDNVLKLRGGNALADVSVGTINLVNAVYYGGYGVPLMIDGDQVPTTHLTPTCMSLNRRGPLFSHTCA